MGDHHWILESVTSTMAMEGMSLEKDDRQRIQDCLDGKQTFQQAVEDLVAFYRKESVA